MQRIERPFRLKKQRTIAEPGCAEFCRVQGGFHASQQTLELREEVLMLLPGAVDAFPSRQVEEISLRLQRLADNAVMKNRVPDEVDVQQRPYVVAVRFFRSPLLDPRRIERNRFRILRPLTGHVLIEQISKVLQNFVAELHSHALFRDRPQ